MATITGNDLTLLGAAITPAAASLTTDFVVPATASVVVYRIVNGTGASLTVTIDDPNTATPVAATAFNADVPIVIATGTTRTGKITDINRFRDKTTGKITMVFPSVTSTTIEIDFL